jgi:hypothetical protein
MWTNNGLYSLVETDAVVDGPRRLPQNWGDYYNINNTDLWSDAMLVDIGWYPTTINDPVYDPALQRLGDYLFTINVDNVVAEREVIDLTQEEIDKLKPVDISDSQRTATDLALQTETVLRQNDDRLAVGASPILLPTELEETKTYLKGLYDAMDNPAKPIVDPPGSIRQVITYPGEKRDRLVITRYFDQWNVPDDVNGIDAVIYSDSDLKGFSIKVHDAKGAYLWTQPFELSEPGIWKTPRHSSYWFVGDKVELQYLVYHNQDLSQKRTILATEEEKVTDIKWTEPGGVVQGVG